MRGLRGSGATASRGPLEANTTWALSTPDEGRLPRTWIAALRRHTTVSLAATTGVADGSDVVKNLLVGA
ncbi:MAG: hypothetical protein WCF36_04135, partial [Candidatus Nanopelagicales bacterium]